MPKYFFVNDEDIDRMQRMFTGTTPRKTNNVNHSKDYNMTYAEIGAVIGVSKQRAEQLCKRAIKKLRIMYADPH